MKDFDETWTSAEAIQALFFPSSCEQTTDICDRRMFQLISSAVNRMSLRSTALPLPQQAAIGRAVDAVRATMPHLTPTAAIHPILWTRWALHLSGLPIANEFWVRLTQWRASKSPVRITLMQYRDPVTNTWRGQLRTAEGIGKLIGYTLDQMLDNRMFPFNEYSVRWRLKTVRLIAAQKRNIVSRTAKDVCGQQAMDMIRKCIQSEKERGALSVLSQAMTDGKYTCIVSPAELLGQLKRRHPEIELYSDSTLKRGLSAYVRCARGRPGGVRPLSL